VKKAHKEFERVTAREGYTLKQLKDKYNHIKAEYRLWQDLMRHTGKGSDEELETVTFPNEVWEELLKVLLKLTYYIFHTTTLTAQIYNIPFFLCSTM